MAKKKKLAVKLLWVFKILILGVTLSYIYGEVIRSGKYEELYSKLLHIGWFEAGLLCLTLLLMVVNWGLESRKWQLLMRHISRISFGRALKAVFSGVTISTWMPNRIGEYIGRVFYLPPSARVKAIFSTIAGSLCQMFITLLAGTIGLLIAWQNQSDFIQEFTGANGNAVLVAVFGSLLLLNVVYLMVLFNLDRVRKLVPQKPGWRKLRQSLTILTYYDKSLMLSVLGLSAIRYFVFALQFYLLLLVFQVSVSFLPALALIAVVFLVQSLVPSIALSELGVRGAASIAILQVLSANTAGIFSASYSLWLVNIIVPSLLGAIFILNARYARKSQERRQNRQVRKRYSFPSQESPATVGGK